MPAAKTPGDKSRMTADQRRWLACSVVVKVGQTSSRKNGNLGIHNETPSDLHSRWSSCTKLSLQKARAHHCFVKHQMDLPRTTILLPRITKAQITNVLAPQRATYQPTYQACSITPVEHQVCDLPNSSRPIPAPDPPASPPASLQNHPPASPHTSA